MFFSQSTSNKHKHKHKHKRKDRERRRERIERRLHRARKRGRGCGLEKLRAARCSKFCFVVFQVSNVNSRELCLPLPHCVSSTYLSSVLLSLPPILLFPIHAQFSGSRRVACQTWMDSHSNCTRCLIVPFISHMCISGNRENRLSTASGGQAQYDN